MSINHEALEALVSIVNQGSFRAAAEDLHKAQSSISYAIKNLEQELDIEIFDRKSYRPKLTAIGKLIYNKAKHILKMQNELVDFTESFKSGVESRLDLCISVISPNEVFTDILKKFKAKYPQTELRLVFSSFDGPINSLVSGEANIIISAEPSHGADLDKLNWRTVEYIPVCTPEYPAASSSIQESYFTSLTQIIIGDRSLDAQRTPNDLIETTNTWSVNSFELKKKFILEALGWGYLPQEYICKEINQGKLVKLPCKNTSYIPLYQIRQKSVCIGPAASYLWDLFIDASPRSV